MPRDNLLNVVRRWPVLSLAVSNTTTLLVVLYLYSKGRGGIWKFLYRETFKVVMGILQRTPGAKNLVASENQRFRDQIFASVVGDLSKQTRYLTLPDEGWERSKVLDTLEKCKANDDKKWATGKVSGCVYHGEEDLSKFLSQVQEFFFVSNPLHPAVFPSVRKMEAEVVSMCVNLFQGGEQGCGTITSGGTESILMACRTAKNYGHHVRGLTEFEIVAPVTAHAAFNKACEYFGIKLVSVDVDPVTRRADVAKMKRAITANTVLLVGSAPCFPNGCVDPISELAELTKKRGILLHVDCCLGSLLIPFARILGYPLPAFDFSVEGVTSISCDTHKYGFAPKGSSVVMYRNRKLREFQYFVCAEWTGGIYASPTMAGSRSGAVSAATWACMMHTGKDGYTKAAQLILAASEKIDAAIRETPGIRVLGSRDLSIISFETDPKCKINIYSLADTMRERGWTLSSLQNPASVHFCVTYCNARMADQFIQDLRQSVQHVINSPPGTFQDGNTALYGMAEALPDKSLIGDGAKSFIDALFQA